MSIDSTMFVDCMMCGTPRAETSRTEGVWTTCGDCGQDWWCVPAEYDCLDEVVAWRCSGGCEDGWVCDCEDDSGE